MKSIILLRNKIFLTYALIIALCLVNISSTFSVSHKKNTNESQMKNNKDFLSSIRNKIYENKSNPNEFNAGMIIKNRRNKNNKNPITNSFLEISNTISDEKNKKKEEKSTLMEREPKKNGIDKNEVCSKYEKLKKELMKLIEDNIEHDVKSVVNLSDKPLNYFKTILEDKVKCLTDYNHDRSCVTLEYRIHIFNKVLDEFIDSKKKPESKKDCKDPKQTQHKFAELLNLLVVCKLGDQVNGEFKPDCKNISQSKEILLVELYKLPDKSLSEKFLKYASKSQECMLENCRSSSSFSIELKYEEEIRKYKQQIESLTKKNRSLKDENILLKKQIKEEVKVEIKKGDKCIIEKNQLLIINKRLENCESDYERINSELETTRKNSINIRKEISISYEKQYKEKVAIYEKQYTDMKELLGKCESAKVKLISDIEQIREKTIKKNDDKLKKCKKDIADISKNLANNIELYSNKLKTCESEKIKLNNKCEDEKTNLLKQNRLEINKIKSQKNEEIKKEKNLREKCEADKKQIEENCKNSGKGNKETEAKIKAEYESKITKISLKYKTLENKYNLSVQECKKRVEICEKKVSMEKENTTKEKIYYEKIIHEKEVFITKEIEKCTKEKLEEANKCKKCDEAKIKDLQSLEELRKKLILQYENEMKKINEKYFKIEGKEMSCKIEVNSLMQKLGFCQDEKLNLIKKFKDQTSKIEKEYELKITNINHSLEINVNRYKSKFEECEKSERKMHEEKHKIENTLHEEIRKIKFDYESKIKKHITELESTKLKHQHTINDMNAKYHIIEVEKQSLTLNISSCQSNSKTQIKSIEEIKQKNQIEIQSLELKLKDLKTKVQSCEDSKNGYINKFKYEEIETKRLLIEMGECKKQIIDYMKKVQKQEDDCRESKKLLKEEKNKSSTQITKLEYILKIEKENCFNEKKNIEHKIVIMESKLKDKDSQIIKINEEMLKCEKNLQEEKMKETKAYEKSITQFRFISEKYDKCQLEAKNMEKDIETLKFEIKKNKGLNDIKFREFEDLKIKKKLCEKDLSLLKIKISHLETHNINSNNFEFKKLTEKLKICSKNLDEKNCENKKLKDDIAKLTLKFSGCKKEKDEIKRKYTDCSNELKTTKKIAEDRKTIIVSQENKISLLKIEIKNNSNKMISLVEEYNKKMKICEKEKKTLEDKLKNRKNCDDSDPFNSHGNSHSHSHNTTYTIVNGDHSHSYHTNQYAEYYGKYQLLIKEKENFNAKLGECNTEIKRLYEKIGEKVKSVNELKLQIEITKMKNKNKVDYLEKEKDEMYHKLQKSFLDIKDCRKNEDELHQTIHNTETHIIKMEKQYENNIAIYKSKINICENKITNIHVEKFKFQISELQEKLEEKDKKCQCEKDKIEEKLHKCQVDLDICNKRILEIDQANLTESGHSHYHNSHEEHNSFTNKITMITNNYDFKLKICNERNDDLLKKYEINKTELRICTSEKMKISVELKSLTTGKLDIMTSKITLLEKEYNSYKEKYATCTEESKSISKKYDTKEKSIKKKYEIQIEKMTKDFNAKCEEINITLKKTEAEKLKILTEKETEIVEIRATNKECNKNLDSLKLESSKIKEKNLCCKNDLFVCNGNFDTLKKTSNSLKIKYSKMNLDNENNIHKLKTCEDDVFKWREKVNELNAEMKIHLKRESADDDFDYSIKNLMK